MGAKLTCQVARYAHAKQFKRMKKALRRLKSILGRVIRDVERKAKVSLQADATLDSLLSLAKRLLSQERDTKNKVYSIHEPSVYCISKGKSHKRYEYGSKVSLVLTHRRGVVLSAQALERPYYDGHSLSSSLQEASQLTGVSVAQAFVDRGYRGHGVETAAVYISGQRRGLTKSLQRDLKHRSSIEPHISHMKSEGKLGRNFLKGLLGDKLNALLCAIGHNLRLLLSHIGCSRSAACL